MSIRQKLKTASRLLKEKNWSALRAKLKYRRRLKREAENYQKWLRKNRLHESDRRKMRAEIKALAHQPLISILVPVYNIEEKFLRRCVESVLAQIYENWELCMADDASPAPHVRRVLEEYAGKDRRVKVVFRKVNGHISAASNSALELATGELTGLLDHDDELAEDALFHVAREINDFPDAAFIYTDEDMTDAAGARSQPKFKPDWSPELFYSVNYVTHFAVYKTELLRAIGGFRAGFEGSQDYDLALRVVEQVDEKQIRHIPRVLYHWRAVAGSVAHSADAKPYAPEHARNALREHFARAGKAVKIERGSAHLHRVRGELPAELPRVSLILWAETEFDAARKTADFYLTETDYENLEIILIGAGDFEDQAAGEKIKTIFRGNLSKAASLNRAVKESGGAILCFGDAGLRPASNDWLKELTSYAVQQEIGAAGGKIIAPDETIAGGGLIVGFNDSVGGAFEGLPADAFEVLYRTCVASNLSAVAARCLAVRRALFEEIGGFDAENLPDALFDADFCLRLGARGRRIVFTPYAVLQETEKTASRTNVSPDEKEFFRRKWQSVLARDPFYNPNLSLRGETFTIEI